ncbi:uncharacterized protein M421DRAFT_211049 [Didymella exigua CBS 183.55]|uniref:F-box domain-containing protein n=1 Tax=Didymella exigua CBS 183.55 TaxID=1150837 RepID=A0A6A5REA9_9PLEO|nr:uncharacterized protein M421DRAFT_211049 [Didymella exigua CBS 183.55]KAF1926585.1 hypothetical protein M421DRAFT_211049 [Didymella exigua CBS 183.55]
MIDLKESNSNTTATPHCGCYITNLTTELIYQIIDFIAYENQVDFALTCRRLADCSSRILKRHQEAFKKYRVASDILPTTIPTLLRSIFGRNDPLLAWHVRSLEIWYDRTSWLDWKPLPFDRPLHEDDMGTNNKPWKWQDDELEEYLEGIEDQLVALFDGGDEDVFFEARQQFENGLDGILKALVIAYCPRLRDVRFITYEHREKSSLGWLKRIVQGSIQYGSHWPPGLCSVKNVAVGVESDTWMTTRHTQHNNPPLDGSDKSMEVFSALLRLPCLNSIYYNDLRRSGWDDQTDYESRALIPKQSSTVKHIFLDDCGDMPYSFRCALTQAPRALETFTLRAGHSRDRMDDADQLISGLSKAQQDHLQTLMFYGPYDPYEIHGYRCNVYRNEELNEANNLKTVAMDISDLELDAFYSTSSFDDQHEGDDWTPDQWCKYFIRWFREHAFPSGIERLVFWGQVGEGFLAKCEGKFLDWLEDALISCIESWRWMEGWDSADEEEYDKLSTAYESFMGNLKAIYLEDIERQYKRTRYDETTGPRIEKVYFRRLVEVAKEAGVDVYTLTNRTPKKHEQDFPTAPDKYDLESGPWWERRDEIKNWVFDVYKGRMVPPGCGKCGKCETCLSQYTKELWRSLES